MGLSRCQLAIDCGIQQDTLGTLVAPIKIDPDVLVDEQPGPGQPHQHGDVRVGPMR